MRAHTTVAFSPTLLSSHNTRQDGRIEEAKMFQIFPSVTSTYANSQVNLRVDSPLLGAEVRE